MADPPRLPAAREHQLIGQMNPRCVRCHRTLIDIIQHPQTACRRRTVVKADLEPVQGLLFADDDLWIDDRRRA